MPPYLPITGRKAYNSFYQAVPVLKEEGMDGKRCVPSRHNSERRCSKVLKKAMWCLGIEVPERM